MSKRELENRGAATAFLSSYPGSTLTTLKIVAKLSVIYNSANYPHTQRRVVRIGYEMAQNRIIFITGGARSGKSNFAEELALAINNSFANKKTIAYIATSVSMDDEFRERIAMHRQRRGDEFATFEESADLNKILGSTLPGHNVLMLECITTWLGNLFHQNQQQKEKIEECITDFLQWLDKHISMINDNATIENKDSITDRLISAEKRNFNLQMDSALKNLVDNDRFLIIVSNEVGLGIVPENPMAREFRDVQGRINQALASRADAFYTILSGIPMRIK